MPDRAVFISYIHEDLETVKRLKVVLDQAGLPVWFDESTLEPGDNWDAKIQKYIKSCSVFIPVISANTESAKEGYFRTEWELAAARQKTMKHDQQFILPIVLNSLAEPGDDAKSFFPKQQWTRLVEGAVSADFVKTVCRLAKAE
jgi:hypothetical protein